MKYLITLSFFCLITLSSLSAQPEIRAHALTESILVFDLTEGYVNYHVQGQNTASDEVVAEDYLASGAWLEYSLNSYSIGSAEDENYPFPTYPTGKSRKSKPIEFANHCDAWEYLDFFDSFGCLNEGLDHIKRHFVYLNLPSPLIPGTNYVLEFNPFITDGLEYWSFTYDPTSVRSEAVHVNNLGYSVNAELKYGYVYQWLGDGGSLDLTPYEGNAFHLIDVETDEAVYSGTLEFRAEPTVTETFQDNPAETPGQNFNQAQVFQCDFSDFNVPGKYRLAVEGIGGSYEFEISCDALRPAYQTAMKGLYHNRSGIELEEEYTDSPRPAPHNVLETPGFAGRLKFTTTTICDVSNPDAAEEDKALWDAGILGDLEESWGWYQDAGDWDAYLTHFDVPIRLFFAFEHFPQNFTQGELNIPESSNDLPDILDEARWLLRFYKRLKDETEAKGWTTGGVPGARVFADLWGEDLPDDIGRGSWQDNDRDWIVSGEDPLCTFNYAAVAAHFSYLLNREGLTDPEGIDWEAEAISAYAWANEGFPSGLSCHDFDFASLKNYAAASLFRLTGEAGYEGDFITSFTEVEASGNGQLQGEQGYGSYIYVHTDNASSSTLNTARNLIEGTADWYLLTNIEERACRWGGNHFFPMLVGQATTPFVFEGIMGYALLKEENPSKAAEYLKYLYTTADYFLGTNPLNINWITGIGENPPKHAFHLDSFYGNDNEPVAGIVPYGPWMDVDYFGNQGPFNSTWVRDKVYPAIEDWPGHERWFQQRTAPLATEFTVHQNTVNAAVLYGVLSGDATCTETVSVEEKTLQSDIFIYPNPSTGVVSLSEVEGVERVIVTDLTGKVLKVINREFKNINLSALPTGLYFLNIRGKGIDYTVKLVKEAG